MPFVVDPLYQPGPSTLTVYAAMSDLRIRVIGVQGTTGYERGYSDAQLFYTFGDASWDTSLRPDREALSRVWTELLERHSYSDAAVFDSYRKWYETGSAYVPGPGYAVDAARDSADDELTPGILSGWVQR